MSAIGNAGAKSKVVSERQLWAVPDAHVLPWSWIALHHGKATASPECAVAFSRFVRVRNRLLFGQDLAASEKRTVDGAAAIFRAV